MPRQKPRNRGSPRNNTTRPSPWFSTTAHAVPFNKRSVFPGQLNPESVSESSVNTTGFAPFFDCFQNVVPSR